MKTASGQLGLFASEEGISISFGIEISI